MSWQTWSDPGYGYQLFNGKNDKQILQFIRKNSDREISEQEAEDLIEKERARNGEPPKEMMTLYNYLHEKHQKTAMEIRVKQGMYKMQEV